jgi:hypothetical protein
LEVVLLEGKVLLSSATGGGSPPQAIACFGRHLLNLDGRIEGDLTPVGSTLQMVSTAGSVHDYGRVQAAGTFTLTSEGVISSGRIVLSSGSGSLILTLVESQSSPMGRNGRLKLQFATGHGTGVYANHCSSGSALVSMDAKRSHLVVSFHTVATPIHSPPQAIPCLRKHLLNLDGRIGGNLTPVGSRLQMLGSNGSVHDYGKVQATGTFALTPEGMISSGLIVLSSRRGSVKLKLVESGRPLVGGDGRFRLQFTTGRGTGVYANHCSSGLALIALVANRSEFVVTLRTTS